MISSEPAQPNPRSNEPCSSPRISFSADFLDEREFISISINTNSIERDHEPETEREKGSIASEFEFLSVNNTAILSTADELFFEGKMLPLWQASDAERSLSKINIKGKKNEEKHRNEDEERKENVPVITSCMKDRDHHPRIWYIDDDPSPRPPKCTVLWKELLRLKRHQRVASSLSPSSSLSSSSSSSSADKTANNDEKNASSEKQTKKTKKGLGRSRSGSISIRPMVNVPICIQGRSSSSNNGSSFLPPLFPLRKGKA